MDGSAGYLTPQCKMPRHHSLERKMLENVTAAASPQQFLCSRGLKEQIDASLSQGGWIAWRHHAARIADKQCRIAHVGHHAGNAASHRLANDVWQRFGQ